MITFSNVTKRYGDRVAVDDLSVTFREGCVTGLLGPNGAGKSTSMRLLLGLDRPTTGIVTVNGVAYRDLRCPLRMVGTHLDGRAVHPGRSARSHLLGLARHNSIPSRRVDEVLALVGLSAVARRRAGGFSLGMQQRLGIAAALLGDPEALVLDEPMNGLDTDGVRWIRAFLREQADSGRTVIVSSHLLAELQQTADRVVVLGQGRLLADCGIDDLMASATPRTQVQVADRTGADRLESALRGARVPVERSGHVDLLVADSAGAVGDRAFDLRIRLHGLSAVTSTLEEGYLRLVRDDVEFGAGAVSEVSA